MKYLIFSNLHSFNARYLELIVEDFDILLFLGDIKASSFLRIRQYFTDKEAYAVLGNHDDKELFNFVNNQIKIYNNFGLKMKYINDLHLKTIQCASS